jgi:AcrR family transcriptional regulator
MSPKRYRMIQRAATADSTRQRIVEATLQLHAERGIVATSHKDVAYRADVSVGTVYHHFPTQDAIVRACGTRVRELHPPPSPDRIDRRAPRDVRVAALVRELVAMYAAMPWLEMLRSERHDVPALNIGITMREEAVARLIRHALGKSASKKKVAVVAAIVDPAVINHLLESGMSLPEIAKTLASIINAWLEGGRT